MFHPPRCPNPDCLAHNAEHLEDPCFYIRRGYYHPKCRARPVPRFRCRHCNRGFSRQTFRADYCDHKPHLNQELFWLLASGIGLRQSGRKLRLSRRCVEMKARKISRHLDRTCRNLMDQFPEGTSFQMDEMETFETERGIRPLTLPVVIEQRTMFIAAAECAPIRPSGKMSKGRAAAFARHEKAEGPRINRSIPCLRRVLRRTARYCKRLPVVDVVSDQKTVYPTLLQGAFGRRLDHRSYSSKLKRDTNNPLFRINLTNAMSRDNNGRLRRRSWLVSKQAPFLNLQLHLFMAYRNYVRVRFNRDDETPAQMLGLVPRPCRPGELLGWRQDWGWYSSHPLSRGGASIKAYRARSRQARAVQGWAPSLGG